MKVKIIWGAPCSGKSTRAKELMTDDSLLWDYDRVLRAMTTKEDHSSDRPAGAVIVGTLRREILYQLQNKTHSETVKKIDLVIILARKVDQYLLDQAGDLEVEVEKMEATLDECLERLKNDDTRPDKEEWEAIIRKWFKNNEPEKDEDTTEEAKACLKRALGAICGQTAT